MLIFFNEVNYLTGTNIRQIVFDFITYSIVKGYLCYKTIFCNKVAIVWLINCFIWRKNNRHCYIIEITLMLFFRILSTMKMKFGQILVCCITNISNISNISNIFWFNAGDWKLVSGIFMILLKWKYSEIWPFLIIDIYHF